VIELRLIDPSLASLGIAFALLSGIAFLAARRLHAGLFVAAAAFAIAAAPSLVRCTLDALAWFGLAHLSLPPFLGWLLGVQGYVVLFAALAVMWSAGALLGQDRPNNSLKRTDQSLRD